MEGCVYTISQRNLGEWDQEMSFFQAWGCPTDQEGGKKWRLISDFRQMCFPRHWFITADNHLSGGARRSVPENVGQMSAL